MELLHYGIKGMKWGVRRFQNKDGTRTAAGKKRYNSSSIKSSIKEVVSHPVLRNTLAYQGYIKPWMIMLIHIQKLVMDK